METRDIQMGEDFSTSPKAIKQIETHNIVMGDDFYLIQPLKEVKISKRVIVETGEKDADGVAQTKQVTKKVPSGFQLGEVLVKPSSEKVKFGVGDIIIYRPRTAEDFDLIKGTKLIRWFEALGRYNPE